MKSIIEQIEGLKQEYLGLDYVNEQEVSISLFGQIGEGDIRGENFLVLLQRLEALKCKKIQLLLNSVGGSIVEGNMMINAIQRFKGEVVGINMGLVASMATSIFLSCGKRVSYKNAWFMIHEPSISLEGASKSELEAKKALMDAMYEQSVALIASKTKLSEVQVRQFMKDTTWLDAVKAQEYGFVDEILDAESESAGLYMEAKWTPKEILNKMDTKEKPEDLKAELAQLKQSLASKEAEILQLKQAEAGIKAEALVEGALAAKKITAEQKEHFVKLATADYESTKKVLDGMKAVELISSQLRGDEASGGDERGKWTLTDWRKKDPKGLEIMEKADPTKFNQLLNSLNKKQ